MSWEYKEAGVTQWDCDWQDCKSRASVKALDSDPTDVKYLKPEDWSGVLITSMTDGDYCVVLCPEHSDGIKRNVVARMRPENMHVVGW